MAPPGVEKSSSRGPYGPSPHRVTEGTEPLACVSCRSRKLKCDRIKPICSRCRKVDGSRVYPESKRKPQVKRRNVRDLEDRLAQVEGYLKEVTRGVVDENPDPSGGSKDTESQSTDYEHDAAHADPAQPEVPLGIPGITPGSVNVNFFGSPSTELMGLGFSECLPPFEVMEELNTIYFSAQHNLLPLVHPGRFWGSFYGSPLLRPPMALQYIMWALAAHGSSKYEQYSDVFYQRARHYYDADEMKGVGEHFITIPHVQAIALIATYEVRRMLFTRSLVNAAKCTRMVQMMGLDRLDGDRDDLPRALTPPTSWVEMEERRRAFWAAYTIDAHASIATGWPRLIQSDDIMTRLPSSEAAFTSGTEEKTAFVDDVFQGAHYAGFACTVVTCNIFSDIMFHVHRSRAKDDPQDVMSGPFWERHRSLDNKLSSTFMFLPAKMRLPQNIKDQRAAALNLNLHASVISLHHAALEKIDKHGIDYSLKKNCLQRLKASADEVANIAKLTCHEPSVFRAPMSSLALYSACTVYVYIAKDGKSIDLLTPIDKANFELLVQAMEAVSRTHEMTRGLLQQTYLDLRASGLWSMARAPAFKKCRELFSDRPTYRTPMLTRNSVNRHTQVTSILPGKLPMRVPKEREPRPTAPPEAADLAIAESAHKDMCFRPILGAMARNMGTEEQHERAAKEGRSGLPGCCPFSEPIALNGPETDEALARAKSSAGRIATNDGNGSSGGGSSSSSNRNSDDDANNNSQGGRRKEDQGNPAPPEHTWSSGSGSSSPSSPMTWAAAGRFAAMTAGSSTSPAACGLGNTAEENKIDLRPFQNQMLTPPWPTNPDDGSFTDQMADAVMDEALRGAGSDPWGILDGDIDWGANIPSNG